MPATAPVPTKECIREVGVYINPRKRGEDIHIFDVHLANVVSVCSKERDQYHT